jgi:hypothetical protein
MRTSIKFLLSIIFLVLAISGCKKGSSPTPDPIPISDTTKPTISITKPTVGQVFISGNTIAFQATFNDNKEIKSYEIVVSKVVTGGLILKIVPTSVPFSYTKSPTNFTSGVKQQEIFLNDITIPANSATTITTPGKYNFKVTCLDTSNNSSGTIVEININ